MEKLFHDEVTLLEYLLVTDRGLQLFTVCLDPSFKVDRWSESVHGRVSYSGLVYHGDTFHFDRNRRGQAVDLDRGKAQCLDPTFATEARWFIVGPSRVAGRPLPRSSQAPRRRVKPQKVSPMIGYAAARFKAGCAGRTALAKLLRVVMTMVT
jgi:hypothetical protein